MILDNKIILAIIVIILIIAIVAGAVFIKIRSIDDNEKNKVVFNKGDENTTKLVVYFSRAGLQSTGLIEKGNTAIVAEIIANRTGADTFELVSGDGHYPNDFIELQNIAKKDSQENARPDYMGDIDVSKYDTVFIGSPVWYTDWPAIVYTFLESNDLSNKNLIPFDTYVGSGLHPLDEKLANECPDSTVKEGIAIKGSDAQKNPDEVNEKVNEWLNDLNLE